MKKIWITDEVLNLLRTMPICDVARQYRWNRNSLSKALRRHRKKELRILKGVEVVPTIELPEPVYPKDARVLIIGDRHSPFSHKKYFEFVCRTRDQFQCDTIVDIGDGLDGHAWSYHEHNPDGYSAGKELQRAREDHDKWYKEFPNVFCCWGNHDELLYRKARTHGLPRNAFKDIKDVMGAPSGWHWAFKWEIDHVIYMHGTGKSGMNAHITWASKNRQSTVIGHVHSHLGVKYMASEKDLIFGMNVGCGLDIKSYAMEYGKDFAERPTLGCGVVLNGKIGITVPMDLGTKIFFTGDKNEK